MAGVVGQFETSSLCIIGTIATQASSQVGYLLCGWREPPAYSPMDVRSLEDAGLFAREAAGYLERDPFTPSVIAVHVDGVSRGLRVQGPDEKFWAVVDAETVVGVAMHTPPHNLFVSGMPPEAASRLAQVIAGAGRDLPGVNGEAAAVESFASEWNKRTGQTSSTGVTMRMYRLGDLVKPTGLPGQARIAEIDDIEVVSSWLEAFHDEVQPHAPVLDWRTGAQQRIGAGQLRLWQDGNTVSSMAGFSSPVAGVSRVGPVYTPPARRRRGYGAAVTAEGTAAALAAGATHVVLYTDLSNPTSNAIYQEIGYRPDHDAEERSFHR
jgi:predicted GNAT family acetyltransferase